MMKGVEENLCNIYFSVCVCLYVKRKSNYVRIYYREISLLRIKGILFCKKWRNEKNEENDI